MPQARTPRGTPVMDTRSGPPANHPTVVSHLVSPKTGATVAATGVTTVPSAALANKRQIADLITHLTSRDNHLWQALTSLQQQANGIVNNVQDWTSWTPKINDDQLNVLVSTELSAYYMTLGTILFTEIRATTLTITPTAQLIHIDLPIDCGETIFKTCIAYLIYPYSSGSITYTDNGVIGIEAQRQQATIYIKPAVRGQVCRFLMGGSVGIIQGS